MREELRPDLKVLYMSGYTEDTIAHDAIIVSGVEFLQKPLVPESLAQRVRAALDTPPPSS